MKKRAVLDSSVLVSAFLTPGGTPGALLAQAKQGALSLCLSPEILAETERVLLRPKIMARYGHTADDVAEYLELLSGVAEPVADLPELRAVSLDPKDDMVVATAVKAGADYLARIIHERNGGGDLVRKALPHAFACLTTTLTGARRAAPSPPAGPAYRSPR